MARDINKLKDRLHAVKGLDSASAYNAQDEDERKKKQAAQLKSDAQINAARQAGEQARLAAIEKNKKILRENREANVQAQKQATAKSNANRAVSPGIEDTISRKQQLTDAMVQLRDWGSGKGDKWQSNNDFQTAYNAYENAMSWAEQSEAAGDIDAAKYMREAASYLAKWGNIAGTELTKLTDQYGSFENAEAYRNGDRSGYREYLNRDKSWKEIDSHIKELEKTIESTSDLKRRSEYMEELDWYNNYARNNYTEAAETELDLLRRKQDTLQNALAQSEINNSPLNGKPVDDDEKSEILKRFDEDIEAAKAANMDPWYISALEKARESFVADASPVSYEQNWQDIDRYDELSGRIGGLNEQITGAEQSLERAKTADWERNNRIKYAALEQEMNAANWYFDNYDYENFKEQVASEKNSAAMLGMPDIYTVDVRDQYTKEEASIYMYLREKGRVEEADAFANYMQSTAAGRRNQQIGQRLAEEDIGIIGRTIGAVAANPGKIANTIDINLQKLGNVLGDEYIPIDYETTGNFGVASNVNREIATQELAALGTLNDALGVEIPYIGSYTLGDLYGTGVDYLNSAMNVALFGTGAAGTALAAEKFSDEYRAAKERGGTDNQAFNYAWGSSIAEGVGEQIVLDRYLGFLTKLGRNPGKAAAIMAGIISVAEGGVQEAATTVMENAVDKWTMGENSEFNIAVRRYEAMGYEHGTAEQMAIDEMNREILKSGIMGALGQGAPVAGGYAAQGISKAAGSVQTAIDDSARGRQIQKMDNAQQMAQLMGEVTGETVTPEKSKRKLGKQQREFIENAGEYVSGADEATRDIVRGKVYDVANASAQTLDGTSQAAKEKAGKRSAAMKTSDTGASVGGESVTVQGFVKTAEKGSDAKLNIKKADGTLAEANMEDVTFDSKNSEVYSYAADMATPELANDFRMRIQPDQMGSIERVANGYSQAYDMARAGFKEASVRASSLTGALTDEQVSAAYKLGAEARKSAQIAAITKAAERAKANKDIDWKGGKASFDDSVVVDALDDTQKAQIDVASVFTGAMGVNVVFFESKADESGRYTRENGSYNRKTNTIYIDVNAGRYYKGDSPSKTALLRTLSHEVTHAVQRNSPEIYSELRDTVTDILGDAKGVTMEDLIDRKMAADSSLTTRDAAMDELVADACERMIEDSDAAQRLAEAHPEAAKTIFQKVGELLKKIGDAIKAAFKGRQLSTEAQLVMKDVERYQKMVDLWTKGVMQTAEVSGREYATGAEDTVENTKAFLDSEEAIQNQARPPYTDKTKACTAFVESLNEEARATYDLLYNFYQASRLGRQNLSSKFMYYSDWNAMVAKDPRWAERAQAMADSIPAAVREKMRMNDDGTLNPNSLETEFKMNRSMGQRIIDALETEVIDTKYVIDGIEYRLSKGNATTAVGGEAYRRAVCEETRKAYRDGTLKQASIGTLSKDKWGSLGFLATNGKTGASGDFTTLCPQMFYNKGCHYCYRLAALTTGVNNKLVGANVWYGGEILRIKDADIDMLNRNGGLRIQSFGDWMPQFSSQLADMLYDADMRGLQIKIITKEPSMIEYVALLREQGLGKSLYFNLSADYAIERAGNRETADYTTMNTTRPYMRDAQGDLWWKRAMTVQEANKYRQKYPWVNTRIVATTQEEFLRGLRDSTVDVVTGYHGNIREWERIDSEDGKVVVNVEALGDAGMPRFSYDAANNEWSIEYEGKTATHKALAHAIADAGLQYEYYVKTCCITGRCATCEGKCGRLAKDFNIKNATNRDGESVAYWQQQMEYDEAGEQTMEYDDVQFQARDEQYRDAYETWDVDIKSADPFTFDDSGELIPLSERFSQDEDIRYQTRDPDQISIRELLVNAIEAEVTDSEENAWLKGYRADLGRMMEKQAELDKQREELDRLTRTARQRRQEAKQRSIEYGARSGLSKTELANLSRYENTIELLGQITKRSEMQQAALDRAQANYDILKSKTEGRLTGEAFEDWRRQKKLSEGDPELLLSDSAKAGLQKARSRVATLSGQLARMDEGLLKLEASKPIMNIVEREREAVKKKADKRVERVRNRYATDAMRKKLSRKAASLDERLRHPKDGAYIPDELRQAAIELDQLIADMNVGYGSDAKKAAERRIDRVRRELAAMKELGTNISQVVDEDLITMLEELSKKAQDMLISEMSVEDLQDIESAIDHVLFLSNSAYDLHIAGKNERIARAAAAQAADMEGKHTKKHKGVIALLQKLARDENLPIYFFRRLGGKFEELAQGLFDGESDFGIIAAEENALIERIKKKHNYDEWFKDGILELVPENGGRLKLNREEALMLYATHKREVTNKRQDAQHLAKGGVVEKHTDPRIKDAENSSKGVKLSEGDMQTISDWLTAEQKAYADEVVAHLSGELADRLNEASRRMHGFSKFTEEYYFPYNVSGLSLPQNINEAQAKLMASVGMAKSTTAEAVKPVTMGEFTDMVTEHIRTALMYATMAPAQQDFMRLLNYQFEDEDSKTTMTEKLTDAYGEDVVKYMLTFMRDIYGRTTDKGSLDALAASMTSRFKKNAVALSASVWLQQYTSMYRAWAVIGPQYFYGKVHNPAKSWEQAKKYAGTAVMKEIGRFDTNVGRNVAEWIANKKAYTIPGRAVEISDAVTGWIPEKMDMLAWTRIWEACKREQAKALGKDTESEEVLKAAGRRMDEVTRLTQVYDSVFSKSAHMRNKGWVAKTFTNFMAESTVVVNMFVDAVLNAKKNPGQLVRTSVMLLGSTIAVNFMASFAYAWRDDDEDETYFEKYIQSVVSGFVDDLNPMNYLPVLNKIVSELKGFTGDSTEMATIADTIGYAKLALTMERGVSLEDRLLYAAHAIGAAMGIPVKNVYREVSGIIRAIKNVGNVKLREDAILNAVKYGALDGSLIATMLGISDSKEYNADQMYKAIRDGDYAEAADLREHLILYNGAKDDKAVDSLLRTRIKDGFTAGEIGADEAIELLTGYAGMSDIKARDTVAEWKYTTETGEPYSKLKTQFLEGEITDDEAIAAIQEFGSEYEADAERSIAEWQYEKDTGRTWSDMKYDYISGEMTAKEVIAAQKKYVDAFEWDVNAQILKWDYERDKGRPYNEMKAAYIEGDITVKEAIADRVKYGGMNKEDAELDISKWNFEIDYGYPYDDMKDYYRLGRISKDKAIAARVKYGKQKQDEAYFAVTGWEYEQTENKEWNGKFTKVHDAIDSGNSNALITAINEVYDHSTYEDGKKAASALTSNITSTYKPLYIEASEAERAQMEEDLLEAYRYAYELAGEDYYGDSRKLKAIRKWLEEDE